MVAHGCTGKGNDQVRFEVGFGVLAPDLQVLAPIRDADIPREKAIALAAEWGIPIASLVKTYSVDENLWGRTAECGPLEDPWVAPPEDAFERTAAPADRPIEPTEVVVAFDHGLPMGVPLLPRPLRTWCGDAMSVGLRLSPGGNCSSANCCRNCDAEPSGGTIPEPFPATLVSSG